MTGSTPPLQPDLFGEDAAAAIERHNHALQMLRDGFDNTLAAGHYRHNWTLANNPNAPGFSRPWAHVVVDAGIRFEHGSTWRGWGSRPRHLFTWGELAAVLDADPRWSEVERALGTSDNRTFAWHRPWQYCGHTANDWTTQRDWADPSWPERLHAWETTRSILADAMVTEGSQSQDTEVTGVN